MLDLLTCLLELIIIGMQKIPSFEGHLGDTHHIYWGNNQALPGQLPDGACCNTQVLGLVG